MDTTETAATEPFVVTDQPDYERTYDEDEVVSIRKGDLRAIMDVGTMSMDFGSGFLDNEQVEALRKGAVILGIDPMTVTPSNFTCTYSTTSHDWRLSEYGGRKSWRCSRCGEYTSDDPTVDANP